MESLWQEDEATKKGKAARRAIVGALSLSKRGDRPTPAKSGRSDTLAVFPECFNDTVELALYSCVSYGSALKTAIEGGGANDYEWM